MSDDEVSITPFDSQVPPAISVDRSTFDRLTWTNIPIANPSGRWIIGRAAPRWNGFLCGWLGHPKRAHVKGGIRCDRCGVLAIWEPANPPLYPWGWNEPA